ncbi:hypothetical protein BST28_18935 [Mycolicibacter kumamotonensis]|uniref:HNH nuclease domain-containing protein n=1 Tax=Mycolicibacter kumamotonensis TaxID=354243 RepID=A0A1X0DY75_9MYCO|nr:hypothetical protein BST28_18935 [Mycolicibacter kumamotonensis]
MDGCTSKVKTHGWCGKHYERWRTTGTTADPVKTTYEDRFWSYVDKTKDCWNWTRAKSKAGYGIFTIERRQKPAHRLSYKFTRGPIPDGMQIDHICHNRACVNPEHLRLATNKQNMENPAGLRVDNTSGHQGVTWDRSCGKWKANVHHNGRNVSAGRYASKEAAAQAVARKRCELFTHNDADREARLNVDAS